MAAGGGVPVAAAEQLALLSGTWMRLRSRAMLETSKQLKALPATAEVLRKSTVSVREGQGDCFGGDGRSRLGSGSVEEGAGKASLSDLQKRCLRARAGVGNGTRLIGGSMRSGG